MHLEDQSSLNAPIVQKALASGAERTPRGVYLGRCFPGPGNKIYSRTENVTRKRHLEGKLEFHLALCFWHYST